MNKQIHRGLALLMFAALGCGDRLHAQSAPLPDGEQKELTTALSEAGNSPIEFARVLELHLAKYPNSPPA